MLLLIATFTLGWRESFLQQSKTKYKKNNYLDICFIEKLSSYRYEVSAGVGCWVLVIMKNDSNRIEWFLLNDFTALVLGGSISCSFSFHSLELLHLR